ncbi:MAG: DUF2334 domain-containing protein [Synergistaceae bacterium]|nr:DUF2334 domain-containing protein [Synergistaceae bacterium]
MGKNVKYLMRLDDASPYWDFEKWQRVHDLLREYNIFSIVAIIPHNEDADLTAKYSRDNSFIDTISSWITEGFTPGLHGYNHVMDSQDGGINPVNLRSEFAGKSLEVQREKIAKGVKIFSSWGIDTKIFIAPAHTFDKNTLEALKLESNIRIISDTIANDIYYDDGFYYIPQQSGQVREMNFALTTFCYHPNTMSEAAFSRLEKFLAKHHDKFTRFEALNMSMRKKTLYDKALSFSYFLRRRIISIAGKH